MAEKANIHEPLSKLMSSGGCEIWVEEEFFGELIIYLCNQLLFLFAFAIIVNKAELPWKLN